MVGVAGRSKGCLTCRKRRVKCDEGKPHCKRCVTARRECEGYAHLSFAIDGLPRAVRAAAQNASRDKDKKKSSRAGSHECLVLRDSSRETSSVEPSDDEFSTALSWAGSSGDESTDVGSWFGNDDFFGPAPEMSLAAFNDVFFLAYSNQHLLNPLEAVSLPYQSQSELPLVGNDLSQACIMSVVTVFFAKMNNQPAVMKMGLDRYGTALTGLNKALADPSQNKSLPVLKSVFMMGLFEMMMPTTQDAWLKHYLGLEQLFKLRGPDAHRDVVERVFLERLKSSMILASVAVDRPSIFSEPEWKTVPWSDDPTQKPLRQYLLDILADTSVISYDLQSRTPYSNMFVDPEQKYLELRKRSHKLLDELLNWFEEWKLENGGHPGETFSSVYTSPMKEVNGDIVTCWDSVYFFGDLFRANEFATYKAAFILVLVGLKEINGHLEAKDESFPDDKINEMCKHAGTEICRTIDYHLQDIHDGAGSLFLLFPMRMAWQVYSGDSTAEGKWLSNISKDPRLGFRGRWSMADRMLSAEWLK